MSMIPSPIRCRETTKRYNFYTSIFYLQIFSLFLDPVGVSFCCQHNQQSLSESSKEQQHQGSHIPKLRNQQLNYATEMVPNCPIRILVLTGQFPFILLANFNQTEPLFTMMKHILPRLPTIWDRQSCVVQLNRQIQELEVFSLVSFLLVAYPPRSQ